MKRQFVICIVLCVTMFLAGCAYAAKTTTADKPAVIKASGDEAQVVITPPTSDKQQWPVAVTAKNPKYDLSGKAKRETKSEYWTFLWPRGPSPAEGLAKEGDVNFTDEGVQIGPTKWTWWDTLWTRVSDFLSSIFWWGIAIGVVLLVLLLLPQTSAITSGILKSIVAFFTPMVGWFQAKAAKKQVEVVARQRDEVIWGGEEFKTAILKDDTLTPDVKTKVLAYFKAAQKGEQDQDTQAIVKDVTA